MPRKLNNHQFRSLIRDAPLVAIDLVIFHKKLGVLLGLRKHRPAKKYWFVPGGRLRKNEKVSAGIRRIFKQECGKLAKSKSFLGFFEHFYTETFFQSSGTTHYLVLAFVVILKHGEVAKNVGKDQHQDLRWWSIKNALNSRFVHGYSKAYFRRATKCKMIS